MGLSKQWLLAHRDGDMLSGGDRPISINGRHTDKRRKRKPSAGQRRRDARISAELAALPRPTKPPTRGP